MSLSVGHYLRIYKVRQGMSLKGITAPSTEGRDLVDELVARLAVLDPDLPCELSHEAEGDGAEWVTFVVSGEQVARVRLQHLGNELPTP